MLIKVKLIWYILSNLHFKLYDWNNLIKNKENYKAFKKYINFLNS
jgi:hypothetical protein